MTGTKYSFFKLLLLIECMYFLRVSLKNYMRQNIILKEITVSPTLINARQTDTERLERDREREAQKK